MQRHLRSKSDRETGDAGRPARQAPETAELHLRNYDYRRGYDLTVRVLDDAGSVRCRRTYTLRPGETTSDQGALPHGEHDVTVELDSRRRQRIACRLSPRPEDTLLVECGNNALSVTQGLF